MISKRLIRIAVEKNHSKTNQGKGPIPTCITLEGSVHAGNAALKVLMERFGYMVDEVNGELDLGLIELNSVNKFINDDSERFRTKINLCENYIRIHS